MALYAGTEFIKGQVKDTNFDSYTPLRIGDVPDLDIEFIDSAQAPVRLGAPGTTVVAPAIDNAIFAVTGIRLRHIPIRRQPCSGHSRRRNECDVTDVRFSACEPRVENSVTKWRVVGSRMKDVLSLVAFTIVALCPAVLVAAVRPPSADLAANESPHCIMASSGAPGFDFEWRWSYFTGWRSSRSISELLASSGSTIHRSPRDE
jgi:hypothetical protein